MSDRTQTTEELPVWGGPVQLRFMREETELYAGSLYLGSLNYFPHKHQFESRDPKLVWRAWLNTDEDGDCVGWFATQREARNALLDAAVGALVTNPFVKERAMTQTTIAGQAKIHQAQLDWINASRKLERLRAEMTHAESAVRAAKFRLEELEVANGR